MLLSSQALWPLKTAPWPLKNSAVAHFWVMAHKLKASRLERPLPHCLVLAFKGVLHLTVL